MVRPTSRCRLCFIVGVLCCGASLIAFLAGSWRILALLREAKEQKIYKSVASQVSEEERSTHVTETKIWNRTSRSASQDFGLKPRRCKTTTRQNQGSLWQSGTLPPKWQRPPGFLFSQSELNYWKAYSQRKKGKSLSHYLQPNQQMPCGKGTSQYTRPGWPEHIPAVGKAPHYRTDSMAEQWRQGSVPSLTGGIPPCNSCTLCGSSLPPVSGTVTSNGQWLPRQCNGCSKELQDGKPNPGMGSFSDNCKQDAKQYAQGVAQLAFHYRLRNHIKWWGPAFNSHGCNSIPSSSSQTVRQALHQIQRGDQNGLRSFERLHLCGSSKGNKYQSGKTFNPLVCDKKGGKVETNYRLQRGKPLPFRLENWKYIFPYLR